ncbi:MAG TPA: RidA family protein [Gemmatimonadales bacterium]|nr:RidA family protein [Gemmatimonadales bacterium]
MRRVGVVVVTLVVAAGPRAAWGQFGGFGGRGGGGRGGRGGGEMGAAAFPTPKLPGAELEGPPDSAAAQAVLTLNDEQADRYAQAYDSFMTATRPQRDSATVVTEKMHDRLASGDRAAAMFYADRLREFGDFLKDQQEKFEGTLRHFLTGDQMKAYRRWKADQDRRYEEKNREEALRWQRPSMGERGGFGGGGGEGRMGEAPADPRTVLPNAAGVAPADLGAQAVRVGRTLYVTSQLPLDSAGALLLGDLRAQADRAFANLAAVLRGAGARPQDVVALTIYVVGYKPDQLPIVRAAGAAYFGTSPPTATVLGVEALSREGALIAVGATAVMGTPSWFSRAAGDR